MRKNALLGSVIGIVLGMTVTGFSVTSFADEWIEEEESYIVAEDDTEAMIAMVADIVDEEFFDDSTVIEQEMHEGEDEFILEETSEEAAEILQDSEGDFVENGTCGENLTWLLDSEGTLTISGSGAMNDYIEQTAPFKNRTDIYTVRIENGVTHIGNYAFYSCRNLTSITIPNSVISIGNMDILPGNLRGYSFGSCSNLESISIPDSVTSICTHTFDRCINLKSITMPNGIASIEGYMFYECNALTNISIPNSVKSIGYSAFRECGSLTSISIPDSVISVAEHSFVNCTSLKSISIPNSVTSIGSGAFLGCTSLAKVIIPSSVLTISDSLFKGCTSLTRITIPNSVSYIGYSAFQGCSNLQHIYFGGTEEQWNNINNKSINELENVKIHFDYIPSNSEKIYADDIVINVFDYLEEPFEDYISTHSTTEYDPDLSYLLAGYSRAAYEESWVQDSLMSFGFKEEDIVADYKDDYTVAYTIARKTTTDNSLLVMIIIRGSYNLDWASNANFGAAALAGLGNHSGFENDALDIYNSLEEHLGGIKTSNVKYVITGHSQGAAAGNLLAVQLENNGVPSSLIYDYNFACPNVACLLNSGKWNPEGAYDNIFNINNAEDPVSFLPSNIIHKFTMGGVFSTWGKYGQSYWFFPDESNHNVAGHDMIHYLRALQNCYPIRAFATYEQMLNIYKEKAVRHFYEFIVKCPVDVAISDSDGNAIVKIINNTPEYDFSDDNIMVVVEEGEKWVLLPANEKYNVYFLATDDGKMTYEVYDVDLLSDELGQGVIYENINLENGKRMISSTGDYSIEDTNLYVINQQEKIIAEVNKDGSETIHLHSWGSGVVTKPATITAAGIRTFTCNVCGETKTESIAKLESHKSAEKITITKKPTIQKPTPEKGKITVKWKHFKHTSKNAKKIWKSIKKVQVQCATDSGFKNIIKSTMVKKNKTKTVIKGLKKKTTFYVRVRYYDGTGYSKWSKVKKTKTKNK